MWNASNNTYRKGPINWNTISSPKDQGGLGFRNLFILNQAYLLKMGWRLKNNENSLWSKTIKEKYYPHNCFDNATEPKSYHSGYWKNIYKTKTILKDTCICIMGNGKNINIWEDKWVGNFKIKDYIKGVPNNLHSLTVNKIVD